MKNAYTKWQAWLIIFLMFAAPIVLTAAATSIDLSAAAGQVRNILSAANGGTGNGFFAVAGPSSTTKTFTYPNASANVLTDNSAVTVPQGGLGLAAVSADQVPTGTASNTYTAKTIPDCTDATGNHLNYTQSTHAWSCGTSSSGGTVPSFADNETPSGSINSSNVTYLLAHTPNPAASLTCNENGLIQRAGGNDFTLSTATITYGVAPQTNTTLVCSYRY